eukprot:7202436-Karenia_brevis.AAC.1
MSSAKLIRVTPPQFVWTKKNLSSHHTYQRAHVPRSSPNANGLSPHGASDFLGPWAGEVPGGGDGVGADGGGGDDGLIVLMMWAMMMMLVRAVMAMHRHGCASGGGEMMLMLGGPSP